MLYSIVKLFWDNSWSITKFLIFVAALAGTFSAIFIIMFRRHVAENWDYYRNDPNILKYSGLMYKENPNDTWLEATQKNYNRVLTEKIRKFVRIFLQPWIGLAEGMAELSNSNLLSMNNMRGGFAYMRAMLAKIMVAVLNKIAGVQTAIMMILLRVREGLKKQIGIFSLLSWTIQNNYFFLWSTMNGPIGKAGDFAEGIQWFLVFMTFGAYGPPIYNDLCFHKNTLVKTPSGSIPIYKLQAGDELVSGRVLATIKIASGRADVYRINGILVSGDHLMFCPDTLTWMRVCDNECASPVDYEDELYCLITTTGIIEIEGTSRTVVFRDYIDTHNSETLTNIRKFSLEWLNKTHIGDYKDKGDEYAWGFSDNTPISISESGETTVARLLNAGDYIWCRGDKRKILARIDIHPDTCPITSWNGLEVSANCCIETSSGHYERVDMIQDISPYKTSEHDLIHFIVEGGALEVVGHRRFLIRDFIDINTPAFNHLIANYVNSRANIV